MNVGLFGGSFDPPHIGHMIACYYILNTTDIDQIWLTPCYKHAFDKKLENFEHRVNMCTLASQIFNNRVIVSTIENELGPKNWTVETVKILKKKYPHIMFSLIIGDDIFKEIEKWKDYKELKKIIKFYVLNRLGSEKNDFVFPHISSSQIRENIKNNKSIEKLLPNCVIEYIDKHKLYLPN
jgi:nicotinate-nucleotide adenylyltransferase